MPVRRMAVILATLLSAFVALCWGTIAALGAFPADGTTAAEVAEQRLGGVGLAIPRAPSFFGNRRWRRRGRRSSQS